ncbi:N amino acid transport system protein [Podosphaera aphanis]|nr:N amino acid transport system protein [Podosphaera aphanis]
MADYKDMSLKKEKDSSLSGSGICNGKTEVGEVMDAKDMEHNGGAKGDKFHQLGWKRLTVVMLVEAIALGTLSIPLAFAELGMILGVIIVVLLGLVAIYTSYVVGQVKLAYPHVSHYADAGRLLMGKFGYELVSIMFCLQLTFLIGSHSLTGAIAFGSITNHGTCSIVFAAISAVILFILAIPPSFAEVAILGYIDFVSVVLAIGITMIGTAVTQSNAPGGLAAVNWSAWPKEGLTFVEAFVSLGNIIFAYSYAVCQFSFMDEMHTPKDFVKSIMSLGVIEIVVYALTGVTIFLFVGSSVESPSLLSAGPLLSKVAFGVALPVIFISGSINTTVVARYIHGRYYKNSPNRHINTRQGWISWIVLVAIITLIAWIIAESIPFFSDLLAISSCLFVSGFTFYFPAWMWFKLIKKGSWSSRENIFLSIVNAIIFIIGLIILFGGTYASIQDTLNQYAAGKVHGPFSCS